MGFMGIDGCKKGWLVVYLEEEGAALSGKVFPNFSEIFAHYPSAISCAVDMPIGLPFEKERGGREADRQGRKLLGKRSSSLFSPPLREWLFCEEYEEVRSLGVSRQSFLIWPKIREVDAAITPTSQAHIFESHPELAFATMHGEPLLSHKRTQIGQNQRMALLKEKTQGLFPDLEGFCESFLSTTLRKFFAVDDLLDACSLVWVAWKHAKGTATCVPEEPPIDQRGLRMEIWY
ncbi:MAG: DUF429 domain-containing protein [Myxococcales bacterium]|nr:DUF429 domain-containing protein [Myxococcales bacterium]MCB9643450.1 DUF429 domain-containing protein [Myxococcales bacterium]